MPAITTIIQHCFGKFGQWNVITREREEKKERKEENKYIKLLLCEGCMFVCTLAIQLEKIQDNIRKIQKTQQISYLSVMTIIISSK